MEGYPLNGACSFRGFYYPYRVKENQMLVLTCRIDEAVILTVPGLDRPITVKIVNVRQGRTQVGFDAPRNVTILRENLTDR